MEKGASDSSKAKKKRPEKEGKRGEKRGGIDKTSTAFSFFTFFVVASAFGWVRKGAKRRERERDGDTPDRGSRHTRADV